MRYVVAREIMTTPVITIGPDAAFEEIISVMLKHAVGGLPVVDDKRRLLGIITKADLLPNVETTQPESIPWRRRSWRAERIADRHGRVAGATAGDLMTKDVITAGEETAARQLGQLMLSHGINRLPIVKDGVVVGIVTRTDILKSFKRNDQAILAAIQEMIGRDLWIEPQKLTIACLNGIVTVSGEVERRSERDLAVRLIKTMDGIVGVNADRFEFLYDDLPLGKVVISDPAQSP
jgi:CBS domain-containing protein